MAMMTSLSPQVFVAIPAYNAETTLAGVLARVLEQGLAVLVVDDGSEDRTAEVARGFPLLEVLSHPENRGKGAALKTAFALGAKLGFTHVLTLDADGQHPLDAIGGFLSACTENPQAILVGNRFAGAKVDPMPAVRHWSNTLSSKLISLAAGTAIPDAQCGMRVYPLSVAQEIPLESDGYALESEVLVKACRRGVKVENIPISCHYPEGTATSRYRAFADSWRIAKAVARALR
jgi:glycosyltransferase involved in cell wall biosynthesis